MQELLVYNAEGKPYLYRFEELSIGHTPVLKDFYHNKDATSTYDYTVDYNHTANDKTKIINELIKYEPSQNFEAKKIWEDNGNQDGKRPKELYVYLIQREWQRRKDSSDNYINVYDLVSINAYRKKMDEFISKTDTDGKKYWYCDWKNYPGFSEIGNQYTYSVVEYYDSRTGGIVTNGEKFEFYLDDIVKSDGQTIVPTIEDGQVKLEVKSSENTILGTYYDSFYQTTDSSKKINVYDCTTDTIQTIQNDEKPYEVGEVITGYTTNTVISTPFVGAESIATQTATLTNTYQQEKRSLTVDKLWTGDTNYEGSNTD